MIKVNFDFSRYNISAKISKYDSIISHMTGNTNFNLSDGLLDIIKSSNETLKSLNNKAANRDRVCIKARDEQEEKTDLLFKNLALVITQQSNTESIALSSGFDLHKTPVYPEKSNLTIKHTGHSGEMKLDKKSEKTAGAYEWSISETPEVETSWVNFDTTTQCSIVVKNLTPGKLYYFRVRTITPKGKSDYSQIISLRAI